MKKIFSAMLALYMVLSGMIFGGVAIESEETTGEESAIVVTIYYTDESGNDVSESYTTLEEALSNSYAGDRVVLLTDYTMSSSATVPAGVTLVIPSSSAQNDTLTGNNASGSVSTGEPYVTLTVPADKALTVNGILLVAGNQQAGNKQTGCLTGDYGVLVVDGAVTVNNGGKLYARGAVSGSGTITAKSGADVYQMLQINDWRGGTATSSIYSSVFPFNLYDVKNITAKTVYEYGSHMYAHYYVVYTFLGSQIITDEDAMIMGSSGDTGSLFRMTASGTSVVVDNATEVTLDGSVSTGPLTIIFNTVFGRVNLSTENMTCPIYNMNVHVENGGSLTITDSLKFLPGSSLTIKDGGAMTISSGKAAYFYTVDGYSSDYYWGDKASVGTSDAMLTVETGASVSGTIGSTSNTLANTSYQTETPVSSTAIVKEATQANTSTTIVDVTFYTYTATASAAG